MSVNYYEKGLTGNIRTKNKNGLFGFVKPVIEVETFTEVEEHNCWTGVEIETVRIWREMKPADLHRLEITARLR